MAPRRNPARNAQGNGEVAPANPPVPADPQVPAPVAPQLLPPPVPAVSQESIGESLAAEEVNSQPAASQAPAASQRSGASRRTAASLRTAGSTTQRAAQEAIEEAARLAEANAALQEELARFQAQAALSQRSAGRGLSQRSVQPPPPPAVAPAYRPMAPPPPPARAVELYVPPPPPNRFQNGPSYWDMIRQLKDMGTEMFGGGVDPVAADNWRRKLEHNLNLLRCPEEYRRDLAVQYLKDEALIWWEGKVATAARNHFELSWDNFKTEFNKKFFPREAMDGMENQFLDLRQGKMSVREYEAEFNRLRRFAGNQLNEEDLIRRFMNGLEVELKNRCKMKDYSYLEELVAKAADQEKGLKEEKEKERASQRTDRLPVAPKRNFGQAFGPGSAQRPDNRDALPCRVCGKRHVGPCKRCFTCNRLGHLAYRCPQGNLGAAAPVAPAPAPAAPAPVQNRAACFRCGRLGHLMRDCPLPVPPPPPQRQAGVAPRVFVAADFEEAGQELEEEQAAEDQEWIEPAVNAVGNLDGVEPIAGMFCL